MSRKTNAILTAIAAALCLSATGAEAGNNSYGGRATVVKTNVLGVNIAIADTGSLASTGGRIDKTNPGVDIPGVLATSPLTAWTAGKGYTARSYAGLADLNMSVAGLINLEMSALKSSTKATCDAYKRAKATGGSQIAYLGINGTPIAVTGAPNQKVSLRSLPALPLPALPLLGQLPLIGQLDQVVTLVINEQQRTQPARNKAGMKVNAVRMTVKVPLLGLTLADVVVSHAKSDITCR